MTRREFAQQCRQTLASARTRVPFRLVFRLFLAFVALGFVAITAEALIRGRIAAPQDRVPTALYTRPTPGPAIVIGGLDRAPLEQRIPVELATVPDHLIQAVLAVEDQRFYEHHGLDGRRIGGALLANLRAGAIAQGGSTVTQQLAKNLFLNASRTPLRKLRELALALVLEARYEKAPILEAYLNEIYLGQDGARPIHGVGAAARFYFGKDIRRITLSESTLLAGMISAPNRYAPTRNPAFARGRRELVLQLMLEQGRISQSAADRARRTGIPTRSYPALTVDGRWFQDFVLGSNPGPGHLPARGAVVYTTLDAGLQRAAQLAVRNRLNRLRETGVEAALVALDPRSGEVLAMVGGRDYGASQFNRATEARRQPGSAFKPVVALAALERWKGNAPAFTLASLVEDGPLRIPTSSGRWEPANYDGQFRGPVTLRQAMEQSLNVPFARIGMTVGPERIAAMGRRLGITSLLNPVPSLALGSSEVSLLELVRAYGVLAAGGNLAPTRVLLGSGPHGDPAPDAPDPEVIPVVDPAVAYLVTSTLEGVVTRGTGRALNGNGRFEGIAGKTGTSNDWRDAWFIAYSPSLVVGVWVGFDDGRSLGLPGAALALPIVASFLEAAASDEGWESFEMPDGVTEGYVQLAGGGWPWECGAREVFLEGTEPEGRGCFQFELPSWERYQEWGEELERKAARIVERLIAQVLEQRRVRR